jgi:hypothetical protein
MLFPNAALLLSAQGEAISGNDVHAFVFFGTMTLRAR